MTPQQQYNNYACAAAALTSFLIDATGQPIRQEQDIVKKVYSRGNPFQVGTAQEGALPTINRMQMQAISLALVKNLDPTRFVSEEYWKDFLRSLTQQEFRFIKPYLDDLKIVVAAHGIEIVDVYYLSSVIHSGLLPPDQTYLVITNVLGEQRVCHTMRWQGQIINGCFQVMDPSRGGSAEYTQQELDEAKCFFVKLRISN